MLVEKNGEMNGIDRIMRACQPPELDSGRVTRAIGVRSSLSPNCNSRMKRRHFRQIPSVKSLQARLRHANHTVTRAEHGRNRVSRISGGIPVGTEGRAVPCTRAYTAGQARRASIVDRFRLGAHRSHDCTILGLCARRCASARGRSGVAIRQATHGSADGHGPSRHPCAVQTSPHWHLRDRPERQELLGLRRRGRGRAHLLLVLRSAQRSSDRALWIRTAPWVNNAYAWNNASNMIFIDQPATTGLSYTKLVPGYVNPSTDSLVVLPDETCPEYAQDFGTCGTYSAPNVTLTANSTESAAKNFYRTLQGFMGAFPQYSREDFHFATESYGGRYGPVFNEYIEQQNAHAAHKIKLKSVMIGNGWYDPALQYAAYYNFTVSPGNTYDYRPFNSSVEEMMAAIGAFQNFSESSSTVSNAFSNTGDDGRESGTIEDVRSLLDQGVQVVMYAGDADYNCNWLGGEAVAERVQHKGFDQAGYADLKTSDGVAHGQVKQSGQFSFVRIYESGHEVPFYQPLASLEMFERILNGTDLATGTRKVSKGSSYKTNGPAKSTFREGNATVQFEVLPADATYNHTTNAPNKSSSNTTTSMLGELRQAVRTGEMFRARYSSQRLFKLRNQGSSRLEGEVMAGSFWRVQRPPRGKPKTKKFRNSDFAFASGAAGNATNLPESLPLLTTNPTPPSSSHLASLLRRWLSSPRHVQFRGDRADTGASSGQSENTSCSRKPRAQSKHRYQHLNCMTHTLFQICYCFRLLRTKAGLTWDSQIYAGIVRTTRSEVVKEEQVVGSQRAACVWFRSTLFRRSHWLRWHRFWCAWLARRFAEEFGKRICGCRRLMMRATIARRLHARRSRADARRRCDRHPLALSCRWRLQRRSGAFAR
ncbi:hypothetical protein L1887_57839 [Cichorium endivia]|nr:hypothetical protein L1887_57839 [Cichorium endivia]